MGKKGGGKGASPKYGKKGTPIQKAANKAAQPTKLGNHFGRDGINPVERGSK